MAKSEISKVTESIKSMSALNDEARQTAELAAAVRVKASRMFQCVRDELATCDRELEELNELLGQPTNYPPDFLQDRIDQTDP